MTSLPYTRRKGGFLPIGDPTADVFFGLEGFHPAARDGQGDGTYRWSTALATLTIPGGEDVALTVAGGRPAGAPPAESSCAWAAGWWCSTGCRPTRRR